MFNAHLYIQNLLQSNPLREPLLRRIIRALELPAGSRGLDAGCGIGLQTLLLRDAVGTDGHITGLDLLPELLVYARDVISKAGLSDQITFREGDVNHLPFAENSFDWVWSADCIGYPAGELAPLLRELIRVVKTGGCIILLGWSSQQVLSGYPLLEARLNGTCSGYLPFLKNKKPEQSFMRASHWFHYTGLMEVEVQTFVDHVQSPLNDGQRTALTSLFGMLWGERQPGVASDDWNDYQRLCKPESPDFILEVAGYHGFFTYTVFRGKVMKEGTRR